MSLKDAVISYGSAMQGLRKKNKWGYMLEGAGSAMVEVGKSLSAFADITASTKLGHDQFQKGFEELGISEFQGIGTTYDTAAELSGGKDAQSTWSSFKESLRERLTTADKMKSSRGDGLFTVGEGVDERAYTSEEVRQVGMLYGDSAKSRLALAEYKLGEGEKGYVEPNKLFGISKEETLYQRAQSSGFQGDIKDWQKSTEYNTSLDKKPEVKVEKPEVQTVMSDAEIRDFLEEKLGGVDERGKETNFWAWQEKAQKALGREFTSWQEQYDYYIKNQ